MEVSSSQKRVFIKYGILKGLPNPNTISIMSHNSFVLILVPWLALPPPDGPVT